MLLTFDWYWKLHFDKFGTTFLKFNPFIFWKPIDHTCVGPVLYIPIVLCETLKPATNQNFQVIKSIWRTIQLKYSFDQSKYILIYFNQKISKECILTSFGMIWNIQLLFKMWTQSFHGSFSLIRWTLCSCFIFKRVQGTHCKVVYCSEKTILIKAWL